MEKVTYERRKKQGHREAMLKDLPVETIKLDDRHRQALKVIKLINRHRH